MESCSLTSANPAITDQVDIPHCFDSEQSLSSGGKQKEDQEQNGVDEYTSNFDTSRGDQSGTYERNGGIRASSIKHASIVETSDFHRMLLELILKYPKDAENTFSINSSKLKHSSTEVMAHEEDHNIAFLAFTAVIAVMAAIEEHQDIQQQQQPVDEFERRQSRTNSKYSQLTDDYSYYWQNLTIADDKDSSLKHGGLTRASPLRRDTLSKRGMLFRTRALQEHRISSLSLTSAAEDSTEANSAFDLSADIKIASLEEQLEDQEEEIMELQDEIKKQSLINRHLAKDLNDSKLKIFTMENNYALLTVKLAAAQSALDDQAAAARETLANTDLQLLEVSLDLQNSIKTKNATTTRLEAMQKVIARLEKSIEDKDNRYKKAVEAHEIDKEALFSLRRERDRLLHQLESTVEVNNLTIDETHATDQKGFRWIPSGLMHRFQDQDHKKAPINK